MGFRLPGGGDSHGETIFPIEDPFEAKTGEEIRPWPERAGELPGSQHSGEWVSSRFAKKRPTEPDPLTKLYRTLTHSLHPLCRERRIYG